MKKGSIMKSTAAIAMLAAASYGVYSYSKEHNKPVNKMKRVVNEAVDSAVDSVKTMNMNLKN